MLINLDPPLHTRVRSLVAKAFTPKSVEQLRGYVGTFIDGRLSEAADRGHFDLIADLAFVLPVTVIGELIGIPEDGRPPFRDWARTIFRAMGSPLPSREDLAAADEATVASETYLRALVEERRTRPRNDLATRLVEVEDGGDRLTDDEVVSNLNFPTMAGFETTMYSIGSAVLSLLRHPDQLRLLQDGLVDARTSTEELSRYEPPITWTSRAVHEPIEIDGIAAEPGAAVALVLAAANRDPGHYDEPDRLDLLRPDPRPLSFGGGLHFCVGAALARLEVQEAVSRVSTAYDLELLDDTIEWAASSTFRGPASLNVQIRPANRKVTR